MKLDDLSDFFLVASNGGFAQASRVSGRAKASLSRKVMDLEASLGVRLFERSSRAVRLTREGELLFNSASVPLDQISKAVDMLRDGRAQPRGRLRISVPSLFGFMWMGRISAQFKVVHPEIDLEVTIEDREVDLVNEGYDLVIRVNPKPNSDLVGICVLRDQLLVVAAPSLIDQSTAMSAPHPQPVPVVVRRSARNPAIWQIGGNFARAIETKPVLELPTLTMILDATLTGIGAAKLPSALVNEDISTGRLVCWGPLSVPPAEIWALHTSRRLASAKVKTFTQFLKTAIPQYVEGNTPISFMR
jgi:DNA-binding transcriptional LysR family regulator